MPSRGRLAKIVVGVAVSAALLIYLFWNVDLHEVAARLAITNWWFLSVSIALNLGSIWVRAWRWYYLFPPGSHPSHLFNALMIGYMGNNVLPLRAGEGLRAYVSSRRGQRFWTVLATIVVERVLDGLAVGLIVVALFVMIPITPSWRRPAAVFIAVDMVAMIALLIIALASGWCSSVARVLFHRWSWVERRAMDVLGTMTEGLRGVRAGHHFVPIALSTALIWLLFALSVWTGLRAAHLDLPVAASWTVLAFLGLGVSLPSSPGYVGVVQVATVWALDIFKVPHTEALSFSLLLHASQFVPVTLYGIVLLLVEHVRLSDATRTTEASAASPQR